MEKKFKKAELIWYLICGFIFLVGLTFVILGIVGDHLPYGNPLQVAQAKMLPWRYFGLIFISAGVLIALFVLVYFAKKSERVIDRASRRAIRLQAMRENSSNENEENK